jgi:hypothetical protein
MSKRILAVLVGVGALVLAQPAAAQGRPGPSDWSILGAETVAPGTDAVHAEFGWPDVSFGLTHGMSSGFDLGARMSLVYGFENTTINSKFGMAFAMPLRWSLARQGSARLLLHVDPGFRFYTYDPVLFGFQFPFGLNLEFPVRNAPLKLGIGIDFNASLFVTGNATPAFVFGPLVGPYLEYHIDRNLAFGVDTRFGPMIEAFDGGTDTRFGFRAQMMLAYHL